jgi:hypothetical protein
MFAWLDSILDWLANKAALMTAAAAIVGATLPLAMIGDPPDRPVPIL